MNPQTLTNLGLTEQQANVYLKLLELGSCAVGDIIKKIDIDRVSCYDTLNRLIRKGLVTFVKKGTIRNYQAVDPEKLLEIATEKEQKIAKEKQDLLKIMPELIKKKNQGLKEQKEATVYSSKEGIKSFFDLVLKEKKTLHAIGGKGTVLRQLKYYFPNWHKQREKQGIKVKAIFNNELRNDNFKCDCGAYFENKLTDLKGLLVEARVCPKCNYKTFSKKQAIEYLKIRDLNDVIKGKRKVIKIGNSIGLTLPEKLKQFGLKVGKKVKLKALTKRSFIVEF